MTKIKIKPRPNVEVGYPESKAVKVWEKDGLTLSVVEHSDMGHYCGYVRFKKRPVREKGYDGILIYVPVHGGITYAEESHPIDTVNPRNSDWVYGFDCSHSSDWSEFHPEGHNWTLEEVIQETEKMAKAISLCGKYETRYLRNISNKGKAKVIDEYHRELGMEFNLQDNFGAMINILSGKL